MASPLKDDEESPFPCVKSNARVADALMVESLLDNAYTLPESDCA